jgi:hypothetical protein
MYVYELEERVEEVLELEGSGIISLSSNVLLPCSSLFITSSSE